MYFSIETLQREAFDSALYNHGVDIARATDLGILGNLEVNREALIEPNKVFPFALGHSLVQFRGLDGGVLLSSDQLGHSALPLSPQIIALVKEHGFIIESLLLPDLEHGTISDFFKPLPSQSKARTKALIHFRMLHYLINKKGLPPMILQVAVPTTLLDREQEDLLRIFWILIPLALLAATITGFVVSRSALLGVNKIIQSAQAIGPSELSARVPVPKASELKTLAETLNEMLGRLERTFASQDQFVADASHQLKTPLAILRGEIDVFRQTARNETETSALLESLSQEVNHLSRTVDNLLTLARFDSHAPNHLSKVRLDEILFETLSSLQKQAHLRQVELRLEIDDSVLSDEHAYETFGDADLLRTMFFNLIENSIKYARAAGGQTEIRLKNAGDDWLVEISDDGIGINQEDLPKIFDRFYRVADKAHQARTVSGVGLGLAIAAKIAETHQFSLVASSQVGIGTQFSARIKKI